MGLEGFELLVSCPGVLKLEALNGRAPHEPIEEIQADLDVMFSADMVNALAERRTVLFELRPSGRDKSRARFHGPTRGLIGRNSVLLTVTRGAAVIHRIFHDYAPFKGPIAGQRNGVLVSSAEGKAIPYALWNLEPRGTLFVKPGMPVYGGMIVGEHTRPQDLDVNPLRSEQLTNIRAAGKDDAVRLSPPRPMCLEVALACLADDELLEMTATATASRTMPTASIRRHGSGGSPFGHEGISGRIASPDHPASSEPAGIIRRYDTGWW